MHEYNIRENICINVADDNGIDGQTIVFKHLQSRTCYSNYLALLKNDKEMTSLSRNA